ARFSRLNIMLFRRQADYRILGRKGSDAFFYNWLPNDLEPEPTAVLQARLEDETRATFQHELTHHFMRQSLSHLPIWLNEGMAEFYSTLRADEGKVFVGSPLATLAFTHGSGWFSQREGAVERLFVPADVVPSIARIVSAPPEVFYASTYSAQPEPTIDEKRQT